MNNTQEVNTEEQVKKLIRIVREGNYPQVVKFSQQHKDIKQIINTPTRDSERALEVAVRFSRVRITHFLLELGADPNATNSAGYTPLILAVWGRKMKLVIMLLKYGADITLKTNKGADVFRFAKEGASKDILHSLMIAKEYGVNTLPHIDVSNEPLYDIRNLTLEENKAIRNETKEAVLRNDISTVRRKLSLYQGLANYQGDPLWCPLILVAAEAGLTAMVSLLIDMGEDMHAPYGCFIALSPFSRALKSGHFDVCTLLIERGVKTIENEKDLIQMLKTKKSPQAQKLRGTIIARRVARKLA